MLDSSALLALVKNEPGAEIVQEALLAGSSMSTVNLAEAVGKLTDVGLSDAEVRLAIDPLGLNIVDFSACDAYEVGRLRPTTRHAGLSLGDRACLALARQLKLPALTTDRTWATLSLDVEVRMIR